MLLKLQNRILEMIAKGGDLNETIETLCRHIETLMPDVICSVLAIDDNLCLTHVAGPSLPAHYTQAINGVAIGDGIGSCGTAAFRGEPVIVTDIATHPYWAAFKQLALPIGLMACWSTPILSAGKVIGTFAFYFRTPRGPTEMERRRVATCVHMCALAMERERNVEARKRLSQTDPLTQMLNRGAFNEALKRREAETSAWGLLLLDADNLKIVNDRLGHKAGDDMIVEIGRRLGLLPETCQAFRIGGDEFAVVVRDADDEALAMVAQTLLTHMTAPSACGGETLNLSVTIGGAVCDEQTSAQDVQQNADHALYHAKERARGGYVPYKPGFGSTITRRYKAMKQVSDAMRDDGIEAYYQPVVQIASGKIIGLEALCRIRMPSGEVIEANEFQDAIRDGRAASSLTERMLTKIAADVGGWAAQGLYRGRIGINVAGADLYLDTLLQRVMAAFALTGFPLSKLVIEVSETVYLDKRDHSVRQAISALRDAGLRVALDDFGTGFASLTHLLTVPVDVVKIDRLFVESMLNDPAGSVIIRGIIEIAERLGIDVVAEGVQTVEQAARLMAMGCPFGQGYLYAPALSGKEVETMLREWNGRTPLIAEPRRA